MGNLAVNDPIIFVQQAAVCPACLHERLDTAHDERIGEFLLCANCGGVYPIRHGVPHLIDIRALLRLPDDRLAVWHLTQQRAAALYRTNDPASCSLGTREDVQIFRQFMHLQNKIVLDVGSGSFILPGYAEATGLKHYVGIDPIPVLETPNFHCWSDWQKCCPLGRVRSMSSFWQLLSIMCWTSAAP